MENARKTRTLKTADCPGYSIVVFDLEATGLKPIDEITQIAAKCGDKIFNAYIRPDGEISDFAKEFTGIHMVDGDMYNRHGKVDSVSKQKAVEDFISFLDSIGDKLVLVSHGCYSFDGPMLTELIYQHDRLPLFKRKVAGYTDTLPHFRRCLPNRREQGKTYAMLDMAKEFLGSCEGGHDALNDVIMLEGLLLHEKIPMNIFNLIRQTKYVPSMLTKYNRNLKRYLSAPDEWTAWDRHLS